MAHEQVIVAAATRPYPGESSNGDAWQVDWHAGACRLAIVDGLGHGQLAADAAASALLALANRPDLSPEEGLRACHVALSGSRGAAISIARIDPEVHQLTYCGVGNAEAGLLSNARFERLIAFRGIVGSTLPRLRTFSHPLPPEWTLIMHTDGIRARFHPDDVSEAQRDSPQALADAILQGWARDTDDATVVVARARA